MKKTRNIVWILLGALFLLAFAGCASGPSADAEKQFKKIKSYEDVITNGAAIADLLIGTDESGIDTKLFGTGSQNYDGSVSYRRPDYVTVNGKDAELVIKCENQKVSRITISLLGGGGLTSAEFEELASYAIAQFGEDYQFTQGEGLVSSRVGRYEWEHVRLSFNGSANSDIGWVDIRFD